MRNENEPRGRQKRCALVVDDTYYLRDIVAKTLSMAGFAKVISAASAPEALTLFGKEGPTNFDLVVTDIEMGDPKKDGLWLASIIRSGNPNLPIIIMSSSLSYYGADASKITPYTIDKGRDAMFVTPIRELISQIFGIG